MTLDFSSGSRGLKRKLTNTNGVLASPDMSMLGLASPELERLIIQQSGMVNTTPTPTQFVFPRSVTEEQEAYARGFVDALEKLHKDDDDDDEPDDQPPQKVLMSSSAPTMTLGVNLVNIPSKVNVPTSNQMSATSTTSSLHMLHVQQQPLTTVIPMSTFTTTTSLPGSVLPTSTTNQTNNVILQQRIPVFQQHEKSEASRVQPGPGTQHVQLATTGPITYQSLSPKPTAALPSTVIDVAMKEEPQTVPCLLDNTDLSPINMETQEVVKLDRKRARNRVAARKCRERKLDRIARLEERVDQLKGQNSDLGSQAQTLREQVVKLKRQIMEHVESGCQVMLAPNLV